MGFLRFISIDRQVLTSCGILFTSSDILHSVAARTIITYDMHLDRKLCVSKIRSWQEPKIEFG